MSEELKPAHKPHRNRKIAPDLPPMVDKIRYKSCDYFGVPIKMSVVNQGVSTADQSGVPTVVYAPQRFRTWTARYRNRINKNPLRTRLTVRSLKQLLAQQQQGVQVGEGFSQEMLESAVQSPTSGSAGNLTGAETSVSHDEVTSLMKPKPRGRSYHLKMLQIGNFHTFPGDRSQTLRLDFARHCLVYEVTLNDLEVTASGCSRSKPVNVELSVDLSSIVAYDLRVREIVLELNEPVHFYRRPDERTMNILLHNAPLDCLYHKLEFCAARVSTSFCAALFGSDRYCGLRANITYYDGPLQNEHDMGSNEHSTIEPEVQLQHEEQAYCAGAEPPPGCFDQSLLTLASMHPPQLMLTSTSCEPAHTADTGGHVTTETTTVIAHHDELQHFLAETPVYMCSSGVPASEGDLMAAHTLVELHNLPPEHVPVQYLQERHAEQSQQPLLWYVPMDLQAFYL